MYAQFEIHISMAKSAYLSTIDNPLLYYNFITLAASYGHVPFVASTSCQNQVGLATRHRAF